MNKKIADRARTAVREASARLDAEDRPEALATQLSELANQLEVAAVELLAAQSDPITPSREEQLHCRTLDDYARLQQQLSSVRALLMDRSLFIDTLKKKGSELASMQVGLDFIRALDQSLQQVIHLMQYDTADRHEVDVRNGFQFSSGSMHYQRFNFAPTKTRKEQ